MITSRRIEKAINNYLKKPANIKLTIIMLILEKNQWEEDLGSRMGEVKDLYLVMSKNAIAIAFYKDGIDIWVNRELIYQQGIKRSMENLKLISHFISMA